MCDIINSAVSAGVSRRSILTAITGGAAALAAGTGLAACSPAADSAPHARPSAEGYRTRLVLLGTAGGPPWWPSSEREGISSAVVVGDRYYLVDAGEGVGRRLRESKLGQWNTDLDGPLDALRGVFLTHLHSDHVVDLNNLVTVGLYNGIHLADHPVPIWGPGNRGALPPLFGPPPKPSVTAPNNPTPGTKEMMDLMVRTYATDFNDRAFDNRKPVPENVFSGHDVPIPQKFLSDPNNDPAPRMSPVVFFEDDRVRVSATLVQHAPVFPALAYRFDTEDGSVVFSGDTGPTPNLIELARNADVLVHEVIDTEWVDQLLPEPRNDAQQGLFEHLIRSHTVVEDVGPIAEQANVGTLALSHLVPGNWPDEKWERAQEGFSGHLVIGRDLDQIGIGKK